MVRQAESKCVKTTKSAAGRILQIKDEAKYEVEGMQNQLQAVLSGYTGPQRQVADATATLRAQLDAKQAEFLRARSATVDAEMALVTIKATNKGVIAEASEHHQQLEAQLTQCQAECENAREIATHQTKTAQRLAAEAAEAMAEVQQLRTTNLQLHTQLAAQRDEIKPAYEQLKLKHREHEAEADRDASLEEREGTMQGDLHVRSHMSLHCWT